MAAKANLHSRILVSDRLSMRRPRFSPGHTNGRNPDPASVFRAVAMKEKTMTIANPNGRVFWAGLLLLLAALTATAQEFRGSLAGKITDPNGAVVPGSKVEIKNIETGIASSALTGEDGSYSFPLLPPGKYQLTVTKENFNTAVREGIQVRVADKLTLDVQLEIGVTAMVTTVA